MTAWRRPTPAPPPTWRDYLLNAGIPMAIAAVATAGLFVGGPAESEPPRRGCARSATGLDGASSIAVDGGGRVYVGQRFLSEEGCVVRIDSGRVQVVARPGGQVHVQLPAGLAVGDRGELFVGDSEARRVLRIAPNGRADVVHGGGGDGRATPVDVAGVAGGDLYLVESFAGRILKRDPGGRVTLLAGDGFDKPVDGAPARTTRFFFPHDVAVGPGGDVYIAEDGHQVWRIDADGRVRLVAGTGQRGFAGDGGPARAAKLGRLAGVAADEVGNVYISDSDNYRVRRVDRAGIITTIAGTGAPGLDVGGDGGPAIEAQLSPGDLAVQGGAIYVVDRYNRRVRVISPAGVINTLA